MIQDQGTHKVHKNTSKKKHTKKESNQTEDN